VIVLGIDSATGGFSAALASGGDVLASVSLQGHVALEQGLAAVTTALQQAGIEPEQLDRVAVGIGPGSFTGVRIAISYAKSLAQGWGVPLVGVNTFDALEAGLHLEGPILTVVRGRTGVISVRYRRDDGEQRASGYIADVLNALGRPSGTVAVLGDAEDVLPGLAERGWSVHAVKAVIDPSALAVATVAALREPAHSLHEVRADYGELPAAKVPKHL
jgi:tRNA threonylcarbamoyladenosine biosynthesis protein TsaB